MHHDAALDTNDTHNAALLRNVHPADWQNPKPQGRYNLVVIGAGTAGLVAAAGAAGLGAKVALIERGMMGGDCLNTGCVPSKALLRAGRVAAAARNVDKFGVHAREVEVNFGEVMARMRRLRAEISRHDSAMRVKELGVDVYFGEACFLNDHCVEVAGKGLEFAKAVICTGAHAAMPPVPGIDAPYIYTNETIFNLTQLPRRMVVLGAGPIGCELAQCFQRLGAIVTLIEIGPRILPREDEDAATIVAEAMKRDGVTLLCNATVQRVEEHKVYVVHDGRESVIECDAILVAIGRTVNVEGLKLEVANVEYDRIGIKVDDFLRTSNHRIFAAGDVCMHYQFTHAADAAARIVLRNALFGFLPKSRVSHLIIPWCTFTDPEIARVGLNEDEAREQNLELDTVIIPMSGVDRAVLDGESEGMLKVCLKKGTDKILGATMVSAHAGESISEIGLAIKQGIGLRKLASLIHPYPTQAEAIKRAADTHMRGKLTPMISKILQKFLAMQR